jgi:hypothetical protein
MGFTCGNTQGREMHTGFWWGNLKETTSKTCLGVDGRLLKWLQIEWVLT